MACGGTQDLADLTQASRAAPSKDAAADQLYLDDVIDSAGEDSATDSEVDASVQDDVREERLARMATRLLTELDADASGALSLEEFLVGPEKRAEEKEVDAERKEKMIAKMTEDFTQYAGDDAQLSLDELKTLLKEVAPRVGHHRHEKFPGQQKERVEQTWADIVAKYDSDGDGLLSETEYEAMESDRRAAHEGPRPPEARPRR
jgi:Ca2+-binding EF-hand superfamily protein